MAKKLNRRKLYGGLALGLGAVVAAGGIAFGVAAHNVGFKQIKEDMNKWYEKAETEKKSETPTKTEEVTSEVATANYVLVINE